MKITDVKVHLLAKKCVTTVAASRGSTDYRFHAIVEVETDEGISGLGEGIGQATLVKTIVETKMRDEAIGLDPFDTAAIYEKLARGTLYWEHKGSVVCAASGIETACWDIMGKALNVPVYKLLGGKVHDKVRAYASDLFWEEDPASMAKTAANNRRSCRSRSTEEMLELSDRPSASAPMCRSKRDRSDFGTCCRVREGIAPPPSPQNRTCATNASGSSIGTIRCPAGSDPWMKDPWPRKRIALHSGNVPIPSHAGFLAATT